MKFSAAHRPSPLHMPASSPLLRRSLLHVITPLLWHGSDRNSWARTITAAAKEVNATSKPIPKARSLNTNSSSSSGKKQEDAHAAHVLELARLREELAKHDQLYHSQGAPVLSDAQYDALKARLKQLEAAAPPSAQNPPQQLVGAAPSSALPKVRHLSPMLSLFSVNSVEDVRAWHAKLLGKLAPPALQAAGPGGEHLGWVVEPKVDGLAVSLIYENNKLIRAATRGDGEEGEDVTHNCPAIKGLPMALGAAAGSGSAVVPPQLEVRGEVYIAHSALEKVNQEQVAAGLPPFANTRNAAAGSLRLLSTELCAKRQLSFQAYQLLPVPPRPGPSSSGSGGGGSGGGGGPGAAALPFKSQWECLRWLEAQGFATSPDCRRCSGGIDAVLEVAQAWMQGREQLGYDADGVVLKLDDLALQRSLGHVGSDPLWALALKFPSGEAVTRLVGMKLNVARSGQVVPVAELEPVTLNGVTIQNATLHNIGFIASLDLRLGDTVLLQRAGDVIPKIVRSLKELRSGAEAVWKPPSSCPCCGSGLVLEAGGKGAGATLWCRNPECEAQATRQVQHFASTCLETSNVGPAVVTQLMDAGLVNDVADFFILTQEQLLTLPKFAAKRSDGVLRGIEKARGMPLHMLLSGLNIRHVGAKTAKDLSKSFATAEQLQGASMEELRRVPGVGPKTAEAISSWMQQPDNRDVLHRLGAAGVSCIKGAGAGGAAASGSAPSPAPPPPVAAASAPPRPAAASKASRSQSPPASTAAAPAAPGAAAVPSAPAAAAAPASVSAAAAPAPPAPPRGPRPPLKLQGLSVVVTGGLSGMIREEFEALVEACGGKLVGAVSGATDVVVTGEKPGRAKLDKAAKLGVPVLSEEEFFSKYAS